MGDKTASGGNIDKSSVKKTNASTSSLQQEVSCGIAAEDPLVYFRGTPGSAVLHATCASDHEHSHTPFSCPNRSDASEPRDTHCVWFFGIVGHEACPILLRTRVHTFYLSDPTKAASLMPCGDHNTYWAVALTGDNIKEAMEIGGEDKEMKCFLKAQFGECNALVKLIEATPPHQIHRRRIEDRPASSSFVSGSAPDEFYSALVGDAAHPARPSLGQGANMALEDAVQLALVLRETDSIEEALREYDSARVLRCAKLQGDSAFVAEQTWKRGEDDGRTRWEDGQASRNRPANQGMGDADFVYNWEPERFHHFPWRPSKQGADGTGVSSSGS